MAPQLALCLFAPFHGASAGLAMDGRGGLRRRWVAQTNTVYNYWEPVHLLAGPNSKEKAFQTWEYAPQYAIRSWAYIALHAWVPALMTLAQLPPYAGFFALRLTLAAVSSLCDAFLYDAVARYINVRTARYTLVFLAGCAGMISASSALLPSSFVMYTTSVAMGFAMAPSGTHAPSRTWRATLAFAVGALGGWPFGLVIAHPFVWEELCMCGSDTKCVHWRRAARWLVAVLAAALVAVPILLVDSLAYGRVVLVPLNTLLYNVLGRASGIGPELYGVEPPSYYLVSLLLAFSVVVPLALMALPTVIASAKFLPQRFSQGKGSHSAWLLGLRVLPVYLWVAVLIVQPHKEERFMYPIYPLLCVNAAVCLYLLRAATETVYLRLTRSPYRASHTVLFSALTLAPLLLAVVLGAMRTLALIHHYRAPLDLGMVLSHMEGEHHLCYGKEWHRFPSHFFVPPSMRVDFVESEFDGILPHHFARTEMSTTTRQQGLQRAAFAWPWAPFTQRIPVSVNERNEAERDRYVRAAHSPQVDPHTCSLMMDVDFPWRAASTLEPRYHLQDTWRKVACRPFLDADASREAAAQLPRQAKVYATLARTLWLPSALAQHLPSWASALRYGEYCLLERISKSPVNAA